MRKKNNCEKKKMISLGGVIGQGLFLSSGANLYQAGSFIFSYAFCFSFIF